MILAGIPKEAYLCFFSRRNDFRTQPTHGAFARRGTNLQFERPIPIISHREGMLAFRQRIHHAEIELGLLQNELRQFTVGQLLERISLLRR